MKKFVSLLSNGLDSPVASYLMIKRKFTPIFLSFLTSKNNEAMRNIIVKIVEKLAMYTQDKVKIYFINHIPNLEIFKTRCERKLTCVLCKRLMIRIAEQVGKLEDTNITVTGDILGEQASQTLDNLYVYNDLIKKTIFIRPLIGMDKMEVIAINKRIGLYEICSESFEGCQYNPEFPETHAKRLEITNVESSIEFNDLIKNALTNAELLMI